MTEQTAPTCPWCQGAIRHARPCIDSVDCIRDMAARLASLEAVVKQMVPQQAVEPAPAEKPVRYETVSEVNLREQQKDAARAAETPTAEPARCELAEDGVCESVECDGSCPACVLEAQACLSQPSANAEPERHRYQMNECGIVNRTPIPPRPEGQGTVSHDEAERSVADLFKLAGATSGPFAGELRLYIRGQRAREQAQADEIAHLKERCRYWCNEAGEMNTEVARLRAELAALKQPVQGPKGER